MDKELLHTKAVREILQLIACGEYSEGKRLPAERRLCERFGISRGTLRKALADLDTMGAITIKPQSGAYVRRFSHSELPKKILPKNFKGVSLEDVIIARRAIEIASIEPACENYTDIELEQLRTLTLKMEEIIDDLPAYVAMDMAFHEHLVKTSKNEVLITAFEAIAEYHRYSQVFSSTYDSCEKDSLKFHKKILSALENRNVKQAVRQLSAHFNDMLRSQSQRSRE